MIKNYKQFLNESVYNKNLNETIINPNFSIVVPGGCNGKCSFCFWKQSRVCENYIGNLLDTIDNLPSQFFQLSLTGGEPTLSPYLDKILENIDRERWTHTVLTTNGTNLMKFIPKLQGVIDYINISRHHYNDEINESLFGTDTIPSAGQLKHLIIECNKVGIDVTLSAVLTEDLDNREEVEKYIEFAKKSGAKQVFFRKQHGSLEPGIAEKSFTDLPSTTHTCPVCRNTTQIINETTVVWKASLEEPSKSIGMIYETIYHEDGTLTSDWEQQFKLQPELIKENVNRKFKWEDGVFECGGGSGSYGSCDGSFSGCGSNASINNYSGCGGGSYSGCGGGNFDDIDEEEEIRKQLLKDRKKKIGKLTRRIKAKSRVNNFGDYLNTRDNKTKPERDMKERPKNE